VLGRALLRLPAKFRHCGLFADCASAHTARSECQETEEAVVDFLVSALFEEFNECVDCPFGQKVFVEPAENIRGGAFHYFVGSFRQQLFEMCYFFGHKIKIFRIKKNGAVEINRPPRKTNFSLTRLRRDALSD